jgi:cytoskeleton-associated protein 5
LYVKFYKETFDPFQPWIRTAAIACVNTWGEHCGFKEFFDGEMIGDALKSGSPTLRIELWAWLTERLPTCKYIKLNIWMLYSL